MAVTGSVAERTLPARGRDMRRCLIVSPHFPPATLAGVHRARHLAKHLPARGWEPVVVCVDEAYHEQAVDPDLARLVPGHVRIVRTAAIPASVARPIGIGDLALRGYVHMRKAIIGLLARQPIDAALITGAPFYTMHLAGLLRSHGIPVVLDFQDPWVSAWGASLPAFSKGGIAHRLAAVLEPRVLRQACFVTSVSDIQNAELAARHRWLDPARMAAIPIGGDPEDFALARHLGVQPPSGALAPDRFNISFVGTVMPRSGPLLALMLRALRHVRDQQPRVGARIRLNFVGTSNEPNPAAELRVLPLARDAGVADAVFEIAERRPFLEALATLAHSDGLLLIGSDEPHYTASKIYPALMSGRPYLSLFHAQSSAHALLRTAGGGVAHAYPGIAGEDALVGALADDLFRLATNPDTFGTVDVRAYADDDASAIAARFGQIFDTLSHERGAVGHVSRGPTAA